MGTHKQLEVWKNSMRLASEIYLKTKGFPSSEIYGLSSQIRRSAVSIPSNISEGAARMKSTEFHYFLRISFGSLAELETLLMLAVDLGYLKSDEYKPLQKQIILVSAQLSGLLRAIKSKTDKNH